MDRNTIQRTPEVATAGMDHGEELLAEVDEPPDETRGKAFWMPPKLSTEFSKKALQSQRRESLLTRQLQSETEVTDEELVSPVRNLSTQSTWSTTSTCDLTSDDGHSVPSPTMSPPLPPTQMQTSLPLTEKPLEQKLKIVAEEDVAPKQDKETLAEKTVEANLGRKRCISFACRGQQEKKPEAAPVPPPAPAKAASPPKRKCMLKFVCPTRAEAESKPVEKATAKRAASPPPPTRRPSGSMKHRGSDSTVTHASPKSTRKSPPPTSVPVPVNTDVSIEKRRYSDESDGDTGNEATRFHEFATSEDEPEGWVQESTCHRNRLTINDTLKKEIVIRKTCQEVEDEVLEEEEEEEAEELDEELAAVAEDDDEEGQNDIEDESDDGFHSDDEEGFANSDSENDDDSDFEWWKPSGMSTAATSVDHLDRLAIVNSKQVAPSSSVGSASSGRVSPKARTLRRDRKTSLHSQTPAVPINRAGSPELPDSTDFVCGTLDEDRPIEQAYFNRKKSREAEKHSVRPQDIDPTFPTSDPEMDEEDDDDVDEVEASDSDRDGMMHGQLDEIHGDASKRRLSPLRKVRSNRPHSPAPPTMRHQSPPPSKQRSTRRSSPPPPRRGTARSPPPRKLFGQSPKRARSPAPLKRMTSPPNSPTDRAIPTKAPHVLAGRPQLLTHTSSLPKGGSVKISKLASIASDDDESTDVGRNTTVPKRGAIDIVKGLERKRQRRKEKLFQKMCAKAAAKAEKSHRVKPGKGCERMREVGLGLQQWHGKAEHILSL